jgi:hypothetical protein
MTGERLFIYEIPAQRWFMFQNMGPSPSGRSGHAMASSGPRIFVLGGESAAGSQTDESALIHVLDTSMSSLLSFLFSQPPNIENTEHIKYPKPDPNAAKPGDKSQLTRKLSTGVPIQDQAISPSPGIYPTRAASPQQSADPEDLRPRTMSPQNVRNQRSGPNGLSSQPPSVNGKPRRAPGGDDDVEGSSERALSPDHARSRSPSARAASPAGPVSIESLVKTVQPHRSESPMVDRDRVKSPDAMNHGQQQQPNLAFVNGLAPGGTKLGGLMGNVTADLSRDLKARESELEALRRREAWMRAMLAQASHAGFIYVNANPGDEDRGLTDEHPKIAEAVITLKQLHGRIQVRSFFFFCSLF